MTISAGSSSPSLAPSLPGSSTSRSFIHTAQSSPPLELHNLKLREGESIFKTAVFLGSMIVVAVLLLVLICMARWDNIISLMPLFNSEPASVAGRRWRWSRRRRPAGGDAHRRQGSARQRAQLQYDVESLPDEQQHPVLSSSLSKKNRSNTKEIVEALPIICYASAASPSLELGSLLLGAECTICLCEFADGDRVRFLPDCCHGFHVECVDVWLIAHASCPSCRNSLHAGVAGSLQMQHQQQQPSMSSLSSILSSSSSSSTASTI